MARMTPRLLRRVRSDFPGSGSADEIARLVSDVAPSERVQAAIVLSAKGDLRKLRDSIALARSDWRDVLVRGDLADEDWTERLDSSLGPQDWPAVGITLNLLTTAEGGRRTPLGSAGTDYVSFQYRPNWGLPGMKNAEQVGALVLCFGHFPVELGDTTRAVIVPFAPRSLDKWWRIEPGVELRMFEGARICGRATVEWITETGHPLSELDERKFLAWAQGQADDPTGDEGR
jgi:hypothetical protein